METVNEKKLRYLEYLRQETGARHHTHREDEYQYQLLKAGDDRAVEEARRIFASGTTGKLSEDVLRNIKYLFVSSATLACRAAIAVGLEDERAYSISDLYIQRMDLLDTPEAVRDLHAEMIAYYTRECAALVKKNVYSRDVARGVDYVLHHLHEPLTVEEVAEEVGLSRSYYTTLFKNEVGVSLSDFILDKRMEAAKNMLLYSDIPVAEISAILAFSSQSHFIRVFKRETGSTPSAYRRDNAAAAADWTGG